MTWISILLMILTHGPTIIKLIIEIRGLLKDLKGDEKKQVMQMCLEDLKAYESDKDKVKLMSAISEKIEKFKTMESKPRGRKNK